MAQQIQSSKVVGLAQRELDTVVLRVDGEEFGSDNLTTIL